MKRILFIIAFLWFAVVFGQWSYYPGYAVERSGDTLPGLLMLEGGLGMQDGTLFIPEGKESKIKLSPGDYRAMGIFGHRHFLAVKKEKHFYFAEVLVSCPEHAAKNCVNLVQLDRDPYLLKEDELISLDELSRQYRKVDSSNLEMPAFRYGGKLHFMLEDCPKLSMILDQFDFQLVSLRELVREYQLCTEDSSTEIRDESPQPSVFARPSLGAGLSLMHFNYASGYLDYLNLAEYKQQLSWGAGLDLLIGKPVHWNRMFFNLALHYHYTSFDFTSAYVTDTSNVNESMELGIQMIKFSAGPRGRLALGRSELDIYLMGQMNFRTALKTDRLLAVDLGNDTVSIQGEIQPPQDIFFGFRGGLEWALPYSFNKRVFLGAAFGMDFPWMDVVGSSAYILSLHFYAGFDL